MSGASGQWRCCCKKDSIVTPNAVIVYDSNQFYKTAHSYNGVQRNVMLPGYGGNPYQPIYKPGTSYIYTGRPRVVFIDSYSNIRWHFYESPLSAYDRGCAGAYSLPKSEWGTTPFEWWRYANYNIYNIPETDLNFHWRAGDNVYHYYPGFREDGMTLGQPLLIRSNMDGLTQLTAPVASPPPADYKNTNIYARWDLTTGRRAKDVSYWQIWEAKRTGYANLFKQVRFDCKASGSVHMVEETSWLSGMPGIYFPYWTWQWDDGRYIHLNYYNSTMIKHNLGGTVTTLDLNTLVYPNVVNFPYAVFAPAVECAMSPTGDVYLALVHYNTHTSPSQRFWKLFKWVDDEFVPSNDMPIINTQSMSYVNSEWVGCAYMYITWTEQNDWHVFMVDQTATTTWRYNIRSQHQLLGNINITLPSDVLTWWPIVAANWHAVT
jgi:hypothetical protein